jgi:predicted phosphoribosyltransferase/dienelactone hydrolase
VLYKKFAFKRKIFKDREEAGRELAEKLTKYKGKESILILALPRGGVPVAFEVAKSLNAHLDVFITKKLRFPEQPELAVGALAENGEIFLNKELKDYCPKEYLEEEILYQREEIKRRQVAYRGGKELPSVSGKTIILIDDGIATGATMIATIRALKASDFKELIVAVPVAPSEVIEEFSKLVDELVVLYAPYPFYAVGAHYSDFTQVSDEEVREYLEKAEIMYAQHYKMELEEKSRAGKEFQSLVHIPADSVSLEGELHIPRGAKGIVIFVHGSGSSRFSPRNIQVAQVLRSAMFGTILFDLLTREEDTDYENRFNIPLLARRLIAVTQWIRTHEQTRALQIGYFGASTGAAAALIAAVEQGKDINAIVSRGGRPDLAMEVLGSVDVPTLFIVGGNDNVVLKLNRDAMRHMRTKTELKVIPGATHLFEEPGALEEVARLAVEWFTKYLSK